MISYWCTSLFVLAILSSALADTKKHVSTYLKSTFPHNFGGLIIRIWKKLTEISDDLSNNCRTKSGASAEDIENALKGKFSTDIKFKNHLACLILESNVFDSNARKLDMDRIFELIPPHLKNEYIKATRTCFNEFKDIPDLGDMAREFYKCIYLADPQSVSVTVSVLTLTFISIDRWYAICFPLKFKSTTGRAKTAIAIIWIVALACEIPEPIYLTAVPFNESFIYFTQCKPSWSDETDTAFMIIKMVFFYLIPLLFMSIAYMQIIRVLWKSGGIPHQAMDSTNHGGGAQLNNTFAMNMNASTEGQLRSRRKAAKMLVAVVGMFAFCFLPVHLLSVLRLTIKLTNSEWNRAFSLISHWLCYANSAINPIIYNFMSGKFRKEFRRAFDSCCQREQRDRYYQCGGTFYHKDSGFASRTQSRNDEIHRLNTYKDFDFKLTRKGTRTSVVQVEM